MDTARKKWGQKKNVGALNDMEKNLILGFQNLPLLKEADVKQVGKQ